MKFRDYLIEYKVGDRIYGVKVTKEMLKMLNQIEKEGGITRTSVQVEDHDGHRTQVLSVLFRKRVRRSGPQNHLWKFCVQCDKIIRRSRVG